MKFYIEYFTDKSLYAGKLVFQGSDDFFSDPAAHDTLLTVGEEMHEGWNHYENPATNLKKYKQFRLVSSVAGGCADITGVSFTGKEMMDYQEPTLTCPVEITRHS